MRKISLLMALALVSCSVAASEPVSATIEMFVTIHPDARLAVHEPALSEDCLDLLRQAPDAFIDSSCSSNLEIRQTGSGTIVLEPV